MKNDLIAGVVLILCSVVLNAGEIKIISAIASSIENDRPELRAENVFDDNVHTRWASKPSDLQWIILDLGSVTEFNKLLIAWEAAYANKYRIEISDDKTNWKTVYGEENSDGQEDLIYPGTNFARYIRMYAVSRATSWGYSIFEITVSNEVLDDGKDSTPPPGIEGSFADKTVFLKWDETLDKDFFYYNIYRRAQNEEKFKKINADPVKNTVFKDSGVSNGVKYSYRITSVDLVRNESIPSKEITGKPSKLENRRYFDIPESAWMRFLGDIPDGCISTSPDRGVAVGGFGAGSFMYTISGSFGPFQTFDSTLYRDVYLNPASFAVYEKTASKPENVKCLSTNPNLPASWEKINTGDGVYYALQPKGWVTYNCFDTDVSQKFFSPIIANNYKETSYPCGVWQFKFTNSGSERTEIALMLAFPAEYVGKNIKSSGFVNSIKEEGEVKALVFKSKNAIGEWAISSLENNGVKLSFVESFGTKNAESALWEEFSAKGRLPGKPLDKSNKAGAICLSFSLEPKESKEVPIVIAWDFPVVRFDSGTEWYKKYTQYFSRNADNAFEIAKESLINYKIWEQKIDAWMSPVLENTKYPDWLKSAAFNELYYNQIGGCFYEGGLKSGHEREFMGLHEEDSKHYVMESPVYTSANTLDVRHYSSIVFAKFWPEIERDTLRCFADGTMYFKFPKPVPLGLVPHDVGDPVKCDPFFKFDVYRHDIPDLVYWKDLSPKFVQQCWRYYYLYQDREFLDYVWPCLKEVYNFMKQTDKDANYLPDNSGSDNTYDAWGLYGTSLLCGGLWVGALESLEKMAEVKNDTVLLNDIKKWLSSAKQNLDKELWIQNKSYYKMDTKGKYPNAIMSDGLNGQLYCSRYGLTNILPSDKIKKHLLKTYDTCVKPMADYNGDGIGDIGAINAINDDGTLLGTLQSDEIWTGTSYFLSALMYEFGLEEEALNTAYGVYYNTYVNEETAFWFNTPESWRINTMKTRPSGPEQYQRPRAVWELIFAIDDPWKQ